MEEVACTAATNVEDGGNVPFAAHFELELFVEAEDGALRGSVVGVVHVTGATAAGWEGRRHGFAQVVWRSCAGRTRRGLRVGDFGVLQRHHIAGTTAAGVDGWPLLGHGGMRLDEEV